MKKIKDLVLPVNNQHGVNIFAIMMVSIVGIMVTVPLLTKLSRQKKVVDKNNFKLSAQIIQNNFQVVLSRPEVWTNTLNEPYNSSLECVREQKSCSGLKESQAEIKIIRGVNDEVLVDISRENLGITLQGKVCQGYSALQYTPGCPIRPVISWTPNCRNTDCSNYTIRLNLSLSVSAASHMGFNLSSTSISMEFNSDGTKASSGL